MSIVAIAAASFINNFQKFNNSIHRHYYEKSEILWAKENLIFIEEYQTKLTEKFEYGNDCYITNGKIIKFHQDIVIIQELEIFIKRNDWIFGKAFPLDYTDRSIYFDIIFEIMEEKI